MAGNSGASTLGRLSAAEEAWQRLKPHPSGPGGAAELAGSIAQLQYQAPQNRDEGSTQQREIPSWMVQFGMATVEDFKKSRNRQPSSEDPVTNAAAASAARNSEEAIQNPEALIGRKAVSGISLGAWTPIVAGEQDEGAQRVPGGQEDSSSGGQVTGRVQHREELRQQQEEVVEIPSRSEMAATALAATERAVGVMEQQQEGEGKVKVTETVDFAGESVQITRFVKPDAAKRKADMQAASSRGLDALLAQMEKKKKLNILDKTRQDWGQLKAVEGVEQELEAHKRSGAGFTDKNEFLQRTELREYERERDAKLAAMATRKRVDGGM